MKRLFAAACGLVFAVTLAGCGSTTDNLDFKVPAGYDSKMNTFIMSMWMKGDKDNPNMIMLMKLPMKMDESKLDSGTFASSSGMKDARVESTDKIQICGDHPAVLVKATGTSEQAKGKSMDVEALVTVWGGSTYMAMYMHPHGSAPDPAGEIAIKSVCQKTAS